MKVKAAIVFLIFLAFILVFYFALNEDNTSDLSANFIGKVLDFNDLEAAEIELPAVLHFHIPNCRYCKNDQALFQEVNLKSKIKLYGINISKDTEEEENSAYTYILKPVNAKMIVELGLKHVPLTIIINQSSEVEYYINNSLNREVLENEIEPIVQKLQNK